MSRNCLAVLPHSFIPYKIQHRSAPIEHPQSWHYVILRVNSGSHYSL
jgi:hypothetical protein